MPKSWKKVIQNKSGYSIIRLLFTLQTHYVSQHFYKLTFMHSILLTTIMDSFILQWLCAITTLNNIFPSLRHRVPARTSPGILRLSDHLRTDRSNWLITAHYILIIQLNKVNPSRNHSYVLIWFGISVVHIVIQIHISYELSKSSNNTLNLLPHLISTHTSNPSHSQSALLTASSCLHPFLTSTQLDKVYITLYLSSAHQIIALNLFPNSYLANSNHEIF